MFWLLALALTAPALSASTDGFLPPTAAEYIADADIAPVVAVAAAEECAARCLGTPGCVSFNLCAQPANATAFNCGVSGWSMSYVAAAAETCQWYRRIVPRNDTAVRQAVPWLLTAPTSVAITAGPLLNAFETNIQYLHTRDPLDMLFFFAQRAGVQVR
jgi:hypothetical protein